MKKLFLLTYSILISVISFAQPSIITFSPVMDTIGSSVTITGTGFNSIANQNIVFFGATQAVVTVASTNSLIVIVPLGATYQHISATNLATNLTAYSAKPFIATFRGDILFPNKQSFATSVNPYAVSIGDLDGDGKPDLAVVNYNSNAVSVFRNTSTLGTSSFAARVNFSTGTSPISISIRDIDSDGKLDLAVTNRNSNTVSVFRNTSTVGTVSFATKVDFITGMNPISINIGDIDNDGKPDLAVANYNNNTVSIFQNTSTSGTVNFATKVDFITGVNPRSVSITDIDSDGKLDLIAANYNSNTVSIFRNISTVGMIVLPPKLILQQALALFQ